MAETIHVFPDVRLAQRADEGAMLMQTWAVTANGINVCVPKGFETDGASIPRFLWRVCGHPLQYPRVYAALVHDYLYSGGMPHVTRKQADEIYRTLLVKYGHGKAAAAVEYYALRLCGGSHWHE